MSVESLTKLMAAAVVSAALASPAFAQKTTQDVDICEEGLECINPNGEIDQVPEPGVLGLLTLGMVGVGVVAWRRRSK